MRSVTDAPPHAEAIVRAAGSNLAFALAVLPRDRRRDMRVFYAFCRVIDDIVDAETAPEAEKRDALDRWRSLIAGGIGESAARPGLEAEMGELIRRRELPVATLTEIIDGVAMDLDRDRYATIDELLVYCHGVASAVGLVSIGIFGCREPGSRTYAEQLGYALQLTNILRDVAEDAARGRIYLPQSDLERFGVGESEILTGKPDPERFRKLMAFEAARAKGHFAAAVAALPESDRRALRSAELMRAIYTRILGRMTADGYRVFEKRYRLSLAGRLAILGRALWWAL